jgi:hypothetical protein
MELPAQIAFRLLLRRRRESRPNCFLRPLKRQNTDPSEWRFIQSLPGGIQQQTSCLTCRGVSGIFHFFSISLFSAVSSSFIFRDCIRVCTYAITLLRIPVLCDPKKYAGYVPPRFAIAKRQWLFGFSFSVESACCPFVLLPLLIALSLYCASREQLSIAKRCSLKNKQVIVVLRVRVTKHTSCLG